MTSDAPIRFGIVGGGGRSEFFLRAAAALPDRFAVSGLVTRNPDTATAVKARWRIPAYSRVEDFVRKVRSDFIVVCVRREVAAKIIEDLVALRMPVLSETPPAASLPELVSLYEVAQRGVVQVAEQYHRTPLLSAQLAIAASGRLGTVSQAQVAQCHDYHGISVMRRALGVGAERVDVSASLFRSPLLQSQDVGRSFEERTVVANQMTGRFDFGDRLGVYDFATEQYSSWIRGNRLLIRGERGEIENQEVRWAGDQRMPTSSPIRRVMSGVAGNLDGLFLRGYEFGTDWAYTNPFRPARLLDDEIAIAHLLVGMHEKITGGQDVYSLAEASQDHYLALLMHQAIDTGEVVRSTTQIWADDIQGERRTGRKGNDATF